MVFNFEAKIGLWLEHSKKMNFQIVFFCRKSLKMGFQIVFNLGVIPL